jgi:hypothetical protein
LVEAQRIIYPQYAHDISFEPTDASIVSGAEQHITGSSGQILPNGCIATESYVLKAQHVGRLDRIEISLILNATKQFPERIDFVYGSFSALYRKKMVPHFYYAPISIGQHGAAEIETSAEKPSHLRSGNALVPLSDCIPDSSLRRGRPEDVRKENWI